MPEATIRLQPILTDNLFSNTQEVLQLVRRDTPYPFLLDAKLGDANNAPMSGPEAASAYDTPANSIRDKWTRIARALTQTDQELDGPFAR